MWMDGGTDVTRLIVAFRNFANAPKSIFHKINKCQHCLLKDLVKDNISIHLICRFKRVSFVHISTLMIGLRIT